MGRRPLGEDEKRKLLSTRFDPSVAKAIKARADASGRSIPAEIEARIEATIGFDQEGLALIERFNSELDALQRLNKGKRWHKDLRTWAAFAEMLATGPIYDEKPLSPVDAEVQKTARKPLAEIYDKQDALVRQLSELGITVSQSRKVQGLLNLNSRDLESASIRAIPGKKDREQAEALHSRLMELDDVHDRALADYRSAMQPYLDEEEGGRELYREHLHSEAVRARAEGWPFNLRHLLRIFLPWR